MSSEELTRQEATRQHVRAEVGAFLTAAGGIAVFLISVALTWELLGAVGYDHGLLRALSVGLLLAVSLPTYGRVVTRKVRDQLLTSPRYR